MLKQAICLLCSLLTATLIDAIHGNLGTRIGIQDAEFRLAPLPIFGGPRFITAPRFPFDALFRRPEGDPETIQVVGGGNRQNSPSIERTRHRLPFGGTVLPRDHNQEAQTSGDGSGSFTAGGNGIAVLFNLPNEVATVAGTPNGSQSGRPFLGDVGGIVRLLDSTAIGPPPFASGDFQRNGLPFGAAGAERTRNVSQVGPGPSLRGNTGVLRRVDSTDIGPPPFASGVLARARQSSPGTERTMAGPSSTDISPPPFTSGVFARARQSSPGTERNDRHSATTGGLSGGTNGDLGRTAGNVPTPDRNVAGRTSIDRSTTDSPLTPSEAAVTNPNGRSMGEAVIVATTIPLTDKCTACWKASLGSGVAGGPAATEAEATTEKAPRIIERIERIERIHVPGGQ